MLVFKLISSTSMGTFGTDGTSHQSCPGADQYHKPAWSTLERVTLPSPHFCYRVCGVCPQTPGRKTCASYSVWSSDEFLCLRGLLPVRRWSDPNCKGLIVVTALKSSSSLVSRTKASSKFPSNGLTAMALLSAWSGAATLPKSTMAELTRVGASSRRRLR